MNKTMRQVLLSSVLILLLVSACSPAPAPTSSPIDTANEVATAVALTVASQNLDTAEAQPQASNTPLPTATEVVVDTPTAVPPLDTPTAIALPTTVPSGGSSGGGGTTVQKEYACDTVNRRPRDNTVYKPGDHFDIKWTIVNTGTRDLRAGLDLKFSNGDKLMADRVVELPALEPREEFSVEFDAVAPSKPGTYVMAYMVEGGLCYPYTAIVVQK